MANSKVLDLGLNEDDSTAIAVVEFGDHSTNGLAENGSIVNPGRLDN
jgi:hypothetical protein